MRSNIFLTLGLLGATSAVASEHPNIIYILADDLGYGDISCFNADPLIETPNIDRLATEGVMMTQAYVYPVSGPTRAAFLTGRHGHEIGMYGNTDSDVPGIGVERPCFVPKMQESGYRTAWFGKWHQGYDIANHPLNNGFDRGYGFLGGMHDFYNANEGSFYNGGPYSQYAHIYDDFTPVKGMKYLTEELTDQTLSFIEQNGDNPFFIYLAYNTPHTPLQAPEKEVKKYLRRGDNPIAATRYAMIDVMDQEIGRILDYLDKNGLAEDTLVVFMSDNGAELEANSGGYRGHKFTIWEGGIRVPMIARLPNVIEAGRRSNSLCGVYDLASTFLTLANGKPSNFGSGVDLMPYLTGEKSCNVRDEFVIANSPKDGAIPYTHNSMNLLMVRKGDWKLVKDRVRGELGLYNLADDSGERDNLYDKNPDVVNMLYGVADRTLQDMPINSSRGYNRTLSDKRAKEHAASYGKK